MANTSIVAAFERMWQHVINALGKKSDISHSHDDRYYTETEVDTKISGVNTSISNITSGTVTVAKADEANHATTADSATSATTATSATKATQDGNGKVISSTYETKSDASAKLTEAKTYTDTVASGKSDTTHNHDSAYDAKGSANSALTSAKSYTDTKTSGLASTSSVTSAVSTHNTSATAHSDIRDLISGLTNRLNALADSDDTTLDQMSEIVEYIKSNKSLIDSITTSKINVSDIVDNLTTSNASKVLSAKQGVAIKALIDALESELDSHTHAIADVSGLQTALDGKAASSHGTHVSYSTTAPVMDGTASVGSASTVARSDHRHPTDTSRASKTEFDSHASDTTKHITSTERTNWNAAKTHADSAHAPSNAEKNQNAFSNIKVGTTTVAADSATDTLELVGSNVTITPDATNDKITLTVADGTTSAKGVVQLTNSTSSTSTTTAATPSSVKSAYDLANTAKTNAATAQTKADSAYNLANSKVDSLSDLGITATAAELNYVDGVTSNVQTQLDGKAASSHTHNYAGSSSAGGAATSANKLATGRTITLSGDVSGSTTFDGSQNVTITATVADDSHNHTIANVDNLQTTLDSKLAKSGGQLNTNATLKFDTYGDRFLTISGNSISVDMSATDGGWAGNFASVKDPVGDTTTMLGWYGGTGGLNHIFMGGTYSDPAMKMTKDGQFTFKKAPKVGSDTVALQSAVDGKANASHTHTVANITDLTVTATELNYMDGVTSNVQTQLDGKANTSDIHTPDWNAGEDEQGYVLNRTHYYEFTKVEPVFDGNLEGWECYGSPGSTLMFVKVSDRVFTRDEVIGQTYTYRSSSGTETVKTISTTYQTDGTGWFRIGSVHIAVVTDETLSRPLENMTKGTYFAVLNGAAYPVSCSFITDFFRKRSIKKLSKDFYEDSILWIDVVKDGAATSAITSCTTTAQHEQLLQAYNDGKTIKVKLTYNDDSSQTDILDFAGVYCNNSGEISSWDFGGNTHYNMLAPNSGDKSLEYTRLSLTGAEGSPLGVMYSKIDSIDPTVVKNSLDNKMPNVAVTTADNGKFLRVVNGAWAAKEADRPDWNALEDEVGYIQNRTHYMGSGYRCLLKNKAVVTASKDARLGSHFVIANGEKYKIVIDGVVYDNLIATVDEEGAFVGAPYNYDTDEYDYSVYPFQVYWTGSMVQFNHQTAGTYFVEIYVEEEVAHKLEDKYVPTPNWNASSNESGHVVNRTHYTEVTSETYLAEMLRSFTAENDVSLGAGEITVGKTYKVVFDEVDYFVTAGNDGWPYLGAAVVNGENDFSEYPFYIHYESGNIYLMCGTTGVHSVSISEVETVVHRLPSEYMPYLISPNGTKWLLSVSDSGVVSATAAT